MDAANDRDRLLTTFTLDRAVLIEWTGIGTAGFLVSLFGLGWLYALATDPSTASIELGTMDSTSIATAVAATLALVAGVVVLHELVHAAVIRYYGGDVAFGFGVASFVLPYAYVTTQLRFGRNQFVAVALAPLVVITTVGFAVMVATETLWLLVPLAFNVGGAVGDIWMTGILLRYPRHVVVEDSETGLRIYGREGDRPRPSTGARRFLRRVVFGTGVGFGALFLLSLAAPILLSVLGVESIVVGEPGTPWSVFAFEGTPDGGFTSSVNPAGVLAASLVIGFLLALLSVPLQPEPGG